MSSREKNVMALFSCILDRLFVEKPAACSIKKKQRAASVNSLPRWLIPSPRYSPKSNVSYWLSGLKVRTPASVLGANAGWVDANHCIFLSAEAADAGLVDRKRNCLDRVTRR